MPTVEVRVKNVSVDQNSIVPPHVFIVVTDQFGNKEGYGFAPVKNLDLWGPGKIYNVEQKGSESN